MAIETFSGVPGQLVAGDSLEWSEVLADYDASAGWSVTTGFRLTDGTLHKFDASGSGTTWTTTIDAPETSSWTPGRAEWFTVAKKEGDRLQVAYGSLLIKPDPESEHKETHAEKALRDIERILAARYKGDKPERSTVGGANHDKTPTVELERLRDKYVAEVNAAKSRRRKLATGQRSNRIGQYVFSQ